LAHRPLPSMIMAMCLGNCSWIMLSDMRAQPDLTMPKLQKIKEGFA
jgi:hypothetical protein